MSSFMNPKRSKNYNRYNEKDNITYQEKKLKYAMKKTTHGYFFMLISQEKILLFNLICVKLYEHHYLLSNRIMFST